MHALSFMTSAARLAVRHGLKGGLQRAAAKANPVLMVIEAAIAVADAVNSYFTLRTAEEHRDALRCVIPHEAARLEAERQRLGEELSLAREHLDQRSELQERLGALVLACAVACGTIWEELHAIRTADLPDIEAFERRFAALEDAWGQMQHAVSNFNDGSQ